MWLLIREKKLKPQVNPNDLYKRREHTSTGVFRFPAGRAAEIAVETVKRWLDGHPGQMERVIFNVFSDKNQGYYEKLL